MWHIWPRLLFRELRREAMASPSVKLFISCVSDEVGSYRDVLRKALTGPNVEVKIQEDFQALGGDNCVGFRPGRTARVWQVPRGVFPWFEVMQPARLQRRSARGLRPPLQAG